MYQNGRSAMDRLGQVGSENHKMTCTNIIIKIKEIFSQPAQKVKKFAFFISVKQMRWRTRGP